MLATLRYELALWRLQKEQRKLRHYFEKKNRELVANKASAIEMQRLSEEEMFEVGTIQDQIARLQTTFFREEANRYMIHVPPFDTEADNAAWEFSSTCAHYQLKREALAELRSAVRKEKTERVQRFQSWATIVIGLIGAMIGLISVLKK